MKYLKVAFLLVLAIGYVVAQDGHPAEGEQCNRSGKIGVNKDWLDGDKCCRCEVSMAMVEKGPIVQCIPHDCPPPPENYAKCFQYLQCGCKKYACAPELNKKRNP